MRMTGKLVIFLLGMACFGMTAQATTLTGIKGDVRVNGGDGFKVVTEAMTVKSGDVVMTGPKGSAEIIYSDNHRVAVSPGRIKTVAKSGKDAIRLAKLRSTAMRQTANEGAGAFLTPENIFVGVAIAGIAGGAIYLATRDDDDKPVSGQ